MSIKKLATWGVLAFLVWWVIMRPSDAAHLVNNIGGLLTRSASGISHFVSSI